MKFWQLMSIVRGDHERILKVADGHPEWQQFVSWSQSESALVNQQDREKLDFVLPEEFVVACLSGMKEACFLSEDGWLRSREFDKTDQAMTFVSVYKKFGGAILEEVLESGSVHVFL